MEYRVSRIRTLQRFAGVFNAARGVKQSLAFTSWQRYCGLLGISGTVQTTPDVEWTPAVREDHPLVIEYEGAIRTSSHPSSVATLASFEDGTSRTLATSPPSLVRSPLPIVLRTITNHSLQPSTPLSPLGHQRARRMHPKRLAHLRIRPPATPPTDSSSPPLIPSIQVDITGTAAGRQRLARHQGHPPRSAQRAQLALRRSRPPGFALSYARGPAHCGWRRRLATMTTMTCFPR